MSAPRLSEADLAAIDKLVLGRPGDWANPRAGYVMIDSLTIIALLADLRAARTALAEAALKDEKQEAQERATYERLKAKYEVPR